ncbi:MAG: SdrD B-like domain-containing protein [Saprospiraceae bacterium]
MKPKHLFLGLLFMVQYQLCIAFPLDFQFTINACNEVDFQITQGTPVAVQWDFGDGTYDNSLTPPTHYYGLPGSYSVCLTASDGVTTQVLCKTVDVSSCCDNQAGHLNLLGQCCFELTLDNAVPQMMTGVRLTLSPPGMYTGSFTYNTSDWGIAAYPPTNDLIELGYIGSNHIPVGTAIPAITFCLDASSVPGQTVLLEWLAGPDVVCSEVLSLDCTICAPAAKTFSMNFTEGNDRGMSLVVDKNTDELITVGTSSLPVGVNTASNHRMFTKIDECGYFVGSPIASGRPTYSGQYSYEDAHIIEPVPFTGIPTMKYLVASSVRKSALDVDINLSGFMSNFDENFSIESFVLPGTFERVNDLFEAGGYIWVIGTRQINSASPNMEGLVIRYDPTGTSATEMRTFHIDNEQTTAQAGYFHTPTNTLYITGKTGVDCYAATWDVNLSTTLNATRINIDGNNSTFEEGKYIVVDPTGNVSIWGNSASSTFNGSKTIFFLNLFDAIGTPAGIVNNVVLHNFSGGHEQVNEVILNADNKFVLTGNSKIGLNIGPIGTHPSDRPFIGEFDLEGQMIWLNSYESAVSAQDIQESSTGYAVIGTQTIEQPGAPFPTVSYDTWLAHTDKKGVLSDCDCLDPLNDNTTLPPPLDAPGIANWTTITPNPLFNSLDETPLDTISSFCSNGCGSCGYCPSCPSGCCGMISGVKFEDTNCDGIKDPFDPELCNWTINLKDASGAIIQTTTTNGGGFYTFTGLCPGTYTVEEVQQNCWQQSYPASGTHTVTIQTSNHIITGVDFGNCLPIDCDNDLIPYLTKVNPVDCSWEFRYDNNLCVNLDRIEIHSLTPGVTMDNVVLKNGYIFDPLYPPTPQKLVIRHPSGPFPSGSGPAIVCFDPGNLCVSGLNSQDFEVKWFVDLACSYSKELCSDTLTTDCIPFCPGICDSISASYISTGLDNMGSCCFDVSINNLVPDYFSTVSFRPLGSYNLPPGSFGSGWGLLQNGGSEIKFFPTSGTPCPGGGFNTLAAGTTTPFSICLPNIPPGGLDIEVAFETCAGDICYDTLNFNCVDCVAIAVDSVYCDAGVQMIDLNFTNMWNLDIHKIVVDYVSPAGTVLTPSSFTFNPAIGVGNSTGKVTLAINPALNLSTPLKVSFQVFELDCCWCFSDTLCIEVPPCPCLPCDSLSYNLIPTSVSDSTCCYSLEIDNACTDSIVYVETTCLGTANFHTQTAGPGWYFFNNPAPKTIYWSPYTTPFLPFGNTTVATEFCLVKTGVAPQDIVVRLRNGMDSIICMDTLQTFCEVQEDTCLVLIADSIICLPNGGYQLNWSVEHRSISKMPDKIIINSLYTNPAGGTASVPIPWTHTFPGGGLPAYTQYTMPPIVINGANPGDLLCMQASIFDTLPNWCCHSDTVCWTLPPCGDSLDCCTDTIGFANAVDNGFIFTWSGNTVQVSNPYLGQCHQLNLDWGDTSPPVYITGSQLPITHTYSGPGPWQFCKLVSVTDPDGFLCLERDHCEAIGPVATSQQLKASQLALVPNPASEQVRVDLKGWESLATVEVYDLLSRPVIQLHDLPEGNHSVSVDISSLPEGLYLVRVRTHTGKFGVKQLVKH